MPLFTYEMEDNYMPKPEELTPEFLSKVDKLFTECCEHRDYAIRTVCKHDEVADVSYKTFINNSLSDTEGSLETAVSLKIFASVHSILVLIQELKEDNELLHKQVHDMNIIINKFLKEE